MSNQNDPTGAGEWSPWGHGDQSAPSQVPAAPHAAPTQSADTAAWPRYDNAPPAPAPEPVWAGQPGAGSPGPAAYPGYPAVPPSVPPPAGPGSRGRGPGWGALIGFSVAAALVAGFGGGAVGALLADNDGRFTGSATREVGPAPGAGATTRPRGSIANIAATVTPSVVTLKIRTGDGEATGSAWAFDDRGHLVTNNHVVASARDGDEIVVVLADGKQTTGKVVGRDASYDLAVVKVDRVDIAALKVGRSADVAVGDQVIAVGTPRGLASTVTTGIVSALNRPVTAGEDDQSFINAIQTDAAINPGNSGGPLLDMSGRVIGVNTAILTAPGSSPGQGGNIGVGFAIPADQVSTTVEQLIATGKAVHPVIGVFLDSAYEGEGVRIADRGPDGSPAVDPDGPAQEAGLRAGDVIVAFEGKPVSEDGELIVAIRARKIGDKVTLKVRRGGSDRDVKMVLKGSGD
jgi:putative serine protease PepD